MQPTGYRLDLMVFSDLHWFRDVASLCEPLTLVDVIADEKGEAEADGSEGGSNSKGSVSHLQGGGAVGLVGGRHGGGTGEYPQLRRQGNKSTCWVVPYPPPPESVWQGYPFVASYHFLADPRVAHLLTSNFGYALKTDFDCFVTPTLIQHFPWQLEVGYMHYTPVLETKQRLQRVAAGLGLRHRGHHDIGPTWYGDVATLIAVANASIPLVYHLLDREFGGEPDGSWRRKWAAGEGWPLWSKDMAVMYATDLVLNHLVETFHISQKYDVHGDSQRYTFTLYHIHCQHGDGNFSKFEFFMHKYRDRDITVGLDFNRVRDYSLVLSVATWRQLAAGKIGAQANGSIITKAGKGPVCAENGGGDVRGPDGGGGGDSADAGIAQEGAGDGKAPPHSEL
ncbi:hypothetical protein Vretimale_12492 [Volvox reticuliferus]|uniref:DUF7164 domain-containing protein n=1 Tax=Volvox reticuliferus TaxID=1737510 RepID=A0A8J4GKB9_9CHLO|nr:hypothetical protein Vretimale_12492 [Volvox reticuliferus]